jgi:2-polyprenyl-3-methyl-5-hydroxy-6-metoxy-1,4-benzoquinol methylase
MMTKNVELTGCPLCGCVEAQVLYELEVPLVRCEQCAMVYLNPQPRVEHQQFYDESYYDGSSTKKDDADNEDVLEAAKVAVRLESCQAVVDRVMKYSPTPGSWLDIGCGPGFLLSQVRDRGWQYMGLDSSPFAPQFARERFGLENVRTGLIEDVDFAGRTFDVISMQHVIEHLYEPVSTMREILKLLKPGGILYLETPDICSGSALRDGAKWLHIKIPEHVLYFSQETLENLLHRLDCEVLNVSKPVPGTGLMNKVCGGADRAKRFYAVAKKIPLFEAAVNRVRMMRQKSMPEEAEHIQMLARKKEG